MFQAPLHDIRISVDDLLERQARERPEHTFIQCIDSGRLLTFAQARDACNQIAAWCASKKIGENDRIVVIGGNSLEYLLLYIGILRHGATLCALPGTLDGNFGAIIDALQPRYVLYHEGLQLPAAQGQEAAVRLPYDTWPGKGGDSAEFFGQAGQFPTVRAAASVGGPDSIATITYTSGTTGRPKGIVHHYSAIVANAIGTAIALEMSPTDRILEYRSFAWLSARARLMTSLYAGSTLVIAEKFSQSKFFEWVKDQKLTIAFAVPTVITMLVARPIEITQKDVPQLRFVTSSTAPLAVEHQRAFEELYGIEVLQFYGISESGGVTVNPLGRRKLGSVGTPALFQDLRIVDADGKPLPPGEAGDIEIGGDQVCTGYLEYDGTITVLRGTRLRTGDLGYVDEEGYLYITGRRSETINRGGAKVSPLEVNNALLLHPDVAEVATIGVPDRIFGEEIASFVVARAGRRPDPEDLVSHCAASLPAYKLPRKIEFVEQIPKTARAKVDRMELLAIWRQRHPEVVKPT